MGIDRAVLEEWEEYVPDVEGQRELFLDEPMEAVTVELRRVSKAELKRYHRASTRASNGGTLTDADLKLARDMFVDHVRNVKNYRIGGVAVLDGGELYDTDDIDLIRDISTALVNRGVLDKGLAKKLKPLCGSCCSGESAMIGGVPLVTTQSVQTTPEA